MLGPAPYMLVPAPWVLGSAWRGLPGPAGALLERCVCCAAYPGARVELVVGVPSGRSRRGWARRTPATWAVQTPHGSKATAVTRYSALTGSRQHTRRTPGVPGSAKRRFTPSVALIRWQGRRMCCMRKRSKASLYSDSTTCGCVAAWPARAALRPGALPPPPTVALGVESGALKLGQQRAESYSCARRRMGAR